MLRAAPVVAVCLPVLAFAGMQTLRELCGPVRPRKAPDAAGALLLWTSDLAVWLSTYFFLSVDAMKTATQPTFARPPTPSSPTETCGIRCTDLVAASPPGMSDTHCPRQSPEAISIGELHKRLAFLSAALVRANERCDEKERENKTLMARLEHVMAEATMADNEVEHERQALHQRETQLCVAQQALVAARQDACVIAQSLSEREAWLVKMEEQWECLLTTAGKLEQSMYDVCDLSAKRRQQEAQRVAALQARLSLTEPECALLQITAKNLADDVIALKATREDQEKFARSREEQLTSQLDAALRNAAEAQMALRESSRAAREDAKECEQLRLALADVGLVEAQRTLEGNVRQASRERRPAEAWMVVRHAASRQGERLVEQVLEVQEVVVALQQHCMDEAELAKYELTTVQQQQYYGGLMRQAQEELERSAEVTKVLAARSSMWEKRATQLVEVLRMRLLVLVHLRARLSLTSLF